MKPHDTQHLYPRPEGEVSKRDEELESMPESKRWDPLPGSEGSQAPEAVEDGEDEDGRSEAAQLVDDGVEQAEREQVQEASRVAKHGR
jgi:hypothetical protein